MNRAVLAGPVAALALWGGLAAALTPVRGAEPALTPPAVTANVVTTQNFCGPLPLAWRASSNAVSVRVAPGTQKMIERLRKISAALPPEYVPFLSARRVPMLQAELARTTNLSEVMQIRAELGTELLRAGRTVEALRVFRHIEEAMREKGRLSGQSRSFLQMQRAIGSLRLGEQENCQVHHTSESCLMPIQPAGFHTLPRGSRGAIEELGGVLAASPGNLDARWLLNIAHMTLGEYPEKVPQQWLIPPSAFASDYDIKKFPDVAGCLGLDVDDLAGGSIVEDFDGDGFPDIMASSWGMEGQLRFFHNNANGTFTERTREAGLWGLCGGLHCVQTDYNNDGHPDVFVLRGAWWGKGGNIPNSLLRNNGDGTFEDVTEAAGILSFHPTQTATWLDYDGDGWLDVFIGNESTDDNPHPCELYRNNRNGTFTECAAAAGVATVAFVKGVTSGDYNNDGRPDLYLSTRGSRKTLFRNDGPVRDASGATNGWKFTDVTEAAGVPGPLYSFPTWFWDYDNDGWEDIMVSGYMTQGVGDIAADYLGQRHEAEKPRLYRNNRDGTFSDVTAAARLNKVLVAMGANFGDLDNDGWLDFYVGTGDPDLAMLAPNRMFRNAEGKFFQDVTTAGGTGHLQKGHGVSFADLDNDGDQDIHIVMGGAYSGDNFRNAVFLNPGHGNHWLKLKLEGVRSNRAAIGARIRVEVETAQGPRSIHKTVNIGASFGANPLRQEIGLGQATAIRLVEIKWPTTGQTQTLRGLTMDAAHHIREGDSYATPVRVQPTPFDLTRKHSHSHAHITGL